jgi:hypothetical protein
MRLQGMVQTLFLGVKSAFQNKKSPTLRQRILWFEKKGAKWVLKIGFRQHDITPQVVRQNFSVSIFVTCMEADHKDEQCVQLLGHSFL